MVSDSLSILETHNGQAEVHQQSCQENDTTTSNNATLCVTPEQWALTVPFFQFEAVLRPKGLFSLSSYIPPSEVVIAVLHLFLLAILGVNAEHPPGPLLELHVPASSCHSLRNDYSKA